MGDVIHTLPVAAALRRGRAAARLAWVVEARWAYLLEGNPDVDEVVAVPRGVPAGVREVRRRRPFDEAVDVQGLIRSALVAAAACRHVAGMARDQVREWPAALLYRRRVRVGGRHVVDRNLELAAALGGDPSAVSFPLPTGREEQRLPDGPFVLASPFAGWSAKEWPLRRWEELAGGVRRRLGLPLVLDVPPVRAAEVAMLRGVVVHPSGLPGLVHASRRAAAVVGVDSGPLHLAAALGRPGVALFGPTDPARNGPYGGTFTVLRPEGAVTSYSRRRAPSGGLDGIGVDAVLEALESRLG